MHQHYQRWINQNHMDALYEKHTRSSDAAEVLTQDFLAVELVASLLDRSDIPDGIPQCPVCDELAEMPLDTPSKGSTSAEAIHSASEWRPDAAGQSRAKSRVQIAASSCRSMHVERCGIKVATTGVIAMACTMSNST